MDIRHYWSLPPDVQAAIRAAVLRPEEPPSVPPAAPVPPPTGLAALFYVLYARDLLIGLGYEHVDTRSDHDCIAAAELEGFA